MSSRVERKPAVQRPAHPAASLPTRDAVVAEEAGGVVQPPAETPAPASAPPAPPKPKKKARTAGLPTLPGQGAPEAEKHTEIVGIRVRPSTAARVERALNNLPRTWTKQVLYDQAINAFIDQHDLDPQ